MVDNNNMEFKPVRALQKAELHIHLEGAIDLKTIKKIAGRKKMAAPDDDFYGDGNYDGFESFVRVFGNVMNYFTREDDFFDLGYDFVERQARQNIVYTEAFFMPYIQDMLGRNIQEVLTGLEKGLAAGEKKYGVKVRLIYSISRMNGSRGASATLNYIEKYPNDRVIGIDLAGMEVPDAINPFAKTFERARNMGLLTVAHAGEFSGPDHVRQTLDVLKPDRIGHGIGCTEDPGLVRDLAESKIPLDISISSNMLLNAVSSLADHPVRRLFDQGVQITMNTDDPALFQVSLSDQYRVLTDHFSFNSDEIAGLVKNGFTYSFSDSNRLSRHAFPGTARKGTSTYDK